jgi:WD40 repeat protein
VLGVALSRDGRTALTGGGDGVGRLWDVATGKLLGPPLRHSGPISAVAFTADGRTACTGGADGAARLWDVATGKSHGPPLRHPSRVDAVAFSTDGRTLLAGCMDGSVRLWEVATGKPFGPPLQQHPNDIMAAAYSADGRTILTGGADGTARLRALPQPMQAGHEEVTLWLAGRTGLEMDARGVVGVLDAPTWEERRRQWQRRSPPGDGGKSGRQE